MMVGTAVISYMPDGRYFTWLLQLNVKSAMSEFDQKRINSNFCTWTVKKWTKIVCNVSCWLDFNRFTSIDVTKNVSSQILDEM